MQDCFRWHEAYRQQQNEIELNSQIKRLLGNSELGPADIGNQLPGPIANISHTSTLPPGQHRCDDHNNESAQLTRPSEVLQFRLAKGHSCNSGCVCSCHNQRRIQILELFERLISSLFIGYFGRPTLLGRGRRSSCHRCRGSRTWFIYLFPAWLVRCAIIGIGLLSRSKGPELLIRCVRVRNSSPLLFYACMQSRVDVVKRLISEGEGSILDVDEMGRSALCVSQDADQSIPLSNTASGL